MYYTPPVWLKPFSFWLGFLLILRSDEYYKLGFVSFEPKNKNPCDLIRDCLSYMYRCARFLGVFLEGGLKVILVIVLYFYTFVLSFINKILTSGFVYRNIGTLVRNYHNFILFCKGVAFLTRFKFQSHHALNSKTG